EFFLGHFFIDAQVPEKAITTLTRGFPLSSVSSCTWTRIITSGFFARAFAHRSIGEHIRARNPQILSSRACTPLPIGRLFSKPHHPQEPWWFPPHPCCDHSMRGERRGFPLDRGLLRHGRCGGRGLVPLDRLQLARHRAREHLVHARDRNDVEAFLDA